MRRKHGKLLTNRSGAAALEFAIIAPLLFASVLGTFEVGYALYEQNHLSGAVAAGARVFTVNDGDESAIRAAIEAKFPQAQPGDLTIAFSPETISGQTFKKITASYNHTPIVNFGRSFSNVTLTATRYAPDL